MVRAHVSQSRREREKHISRHCVCSSSLLVSPIITMTMSSFGPSAQRTVAAVVTASALGSVAYAWVAKGGGPKSLARTGVFGKRYADVRLNPSSSRLAP